MECTVHKTKPLTPEKALEKLEKFLQRNQANQTQALAQQQQAAEFQAAGGDDEAAAAIGLIQHRVNHIAPDKFYQLTLIRDAMRQEQQAQTPAKEESDDE